MVNPILQENNQEEVNSILSEEEVRKAKLSKNRAFAATVASDSATPMAEYLKMLEESDRGEFQSYISVKNRVDNAYQEDLTEVFNQDIQDPSNNPEDLAEEALVIADMVERGQPIEEAAYEKPLNRYAVEGNPERVAAYRRLKKEKVSKDQLLLRIIDNEVAASTGQISELIPQLIDTMLPGAVAQLTGAVNDVIPEDYPRKWYQDKLAGSAVYSFVDYLETLPFEKQISKMEELVDSVRKGAGVALSQKTDIPGTNVELPTFGTDITGNQLQNDFDKVMMLEFVREAMLQNNLGETDKLSLAMMNIASVLDVPGLGLLSKGAASLTTKSAKNIRDRYLVAREKKRVETVSDLNPKQGSTIDTEILKDVTGNVTETTGKTKQDVLMGIHPTVEMEGKSYGVNTVQLQEAVAELQNRAQKAIDVPPNTLVVPDETVKKNIKEIQDTLENVADVVPHTGYTTVARNPDNNNIAYKARYGQLDGGFETLEEAEEAVQALSPYLRKKGVADVMPGTSIAFKSRATDEVVDYDEAIHKGMEGEFFVQVQGEQKLRWAQAEPFKEDDILQQGQILKWFGTPSDQFGESIYNPATLVVERAGVIRKNLESVIEPYAKLGNKGQLKVNSALQKGDAEGRVLREEELIHDYAMSFKEREAYYSARVAEDTIYTINNRQTREDLIGEGFVNSYPVRGEDGTLLFDGAVKKIELANAVGLLDDGFGVKIVKPGDAPISFFGTEALDPTTMTSLTLTQQNISDIYAKGGFIGRLKHQFEAPNNELYDVVIVSDPKKLRDLPQNVLPYREGHIKRINSDPFYIMEKRSGRKNGKPYEYEAVVRTATSQRKAKQWIKQESTKRGLISPEDTFSVKIDENVISKKDIEGDVAEFTNPSTAMWYQPRGERLRRTDGTDTPIKDSLESISRSMAGTANYVSHADTLNVLKERHFQSFKDLYTKDPSSGDFSFTLRTGALSGREKQANLLWEYLGDLQSSITATDRLWNRAMAGLANTFSQAPVIGDVAAKIALDGGTKINPLQLASGATFLFGVAARPTRQAFLNAMTINHLQGVDPLLVGRSMAESNLMMQSLGVTGNPKMKALEAPIMAQAKVLGYSADEWKIIVNEFKKSGKIEKVDSHVFVEDLALQNTFKGIPKSAMGQLARAGANLGRISAKGLKGAGFTPGEIYNQMAAWNFARKRWEKLNKGKKWNNSQNSIDQVASMATNYSIDLTKSGVPLYNRTALKIPAQFLSFQHKALLNLMPNVPGLNKFYRGNLQVTQKLDRTDPAYKRSIKALTGLRARYIAGAAAAFGAEGLGVDEWWDQMKIKHDITHDDSSLDRFITKGYVGMLFGKSLQLAFQDEKAPESNFSKDTSIHAVLGEIPGAILLAEDSLKEVLLGPAGDILPGFLDAISRASIYTQATPRQERDIEWLTESGGIIGSSFGMFSDWVKVNAAYAHEKMTGEFRDINGAEEKVGFETTKAEQFLKKWFGIKTLSSQEYYDRWVIPQNELKDEARKAAKDYVVLFRNVMGDEGLSEEQKFSKIEKINTYMREGNAQFGMYFDEAAKRAMLDTGKNEEWFVRWSLTNFRLDQDGMSPEAIAEMKAQVQSSKLMDEETKADMLNLIDSTVKDIRAAENLRVEGI